MDKKERIYKLAMEIVNELNSDNKVLLSSLNPGESFVAGEEEFIVLDHEYNGGTLAITKGFVTDESVEFGESTDYGSSNLKKVIENNIENPLIAKIGKENFIKHEVSLESVDGQNKSKVTEEIFRPITFDEARKYNDLLVCNKLNEWWWTITPWSTSDRGWSSVAVVAPGGLISFNYCYDYNGVRPVCIFNSNIFVSKEEN